ncbi:hypothetical protein I2494_04175 [Budviciaceae bacterium BWR-B9]|uniref:Uncharacterized protein n=1 Tax=Limnobaculum allomyrinae TaxID=2791986 RepID=A0ABS1IME8_9GAMM|nr:MULTISPECIES: hypothetical protein [Limnobaculum]MBK5142920.1 hypothetical protein [Limnobaculum allomyrinae]MBV7690193.1 hypothetical protein [Limnobaculum sp. M2-1]
MPINWSPLITPSLKLPPSVDNAIHSIGINGSYQCADKTELRSSSDAGLRYLGWDYHANEPMQQN